MSWRSQEHLGHRQLVRLKRVGPDVHQPPLTNRGDRL